MPEWTIVSLNTRLASQSKCSTEEEKLIKDKHSCVTNGSMVDLRVFVLGGYIHSDVCSHLAAPGLGSYIGFPLQQKA